MPNTIADSGALSTVAPLSASASEAPFSDRRSRRVVVLAHCILNQNAKLDRCAHCPGAVTGVVEALLEHGVGMVQMPCPEMLALGLDRQAAPNEPAARPTVAEEDTRIARRMRDTAARKIVKRIAGDTAQQIADYRQHGFEVIGALGINGSPSCGIEITWRDDAEQNGYGDLTAELARLLDSAAIHVPMRGIRSSDLPHAIATIRSLLATTA